MPGECSGAFASHKSFQKINRDSMTQVYEGNLRREFMTGDQFEEDIAYAAREFLQSQERKFKRKIETFFDKIKHGDEVHQAWIKKVIDEHFEEYL